MTKALFSHKSDEWSTPQDLFDNLNREFEFELDPCATVENHKCSIYFTAKENGLVKSWNGYKTFCNPPYSKISEWCRKCFEEWANGSTIVMLIPARTDTKYFHEYVLPYAEIRFIKGRLKFGNAKENAPFPSILCVYRATKEVTMKRYIDDDFAPVVHAKIKNWRCTNCNIGLPVTKVENHNGIVWQYVGEMKYCPNCGAKLEVNNES